MIRRPPRSTLSSSSAASDVYKRQLQSFLIQFHSDGSSSCASLASSRGKPYGPVGPQPSLASPQGVPTTPYRVASLNLADPSFSPPFPPARIRAAVDRQNRRLLQGTLRLFDELLAMNPEIICVQEISQLWYLLVLRHLGADWQGTHDGAPSTCVYVNVNILGPVPPSTFAGGVSATIPFFPMTQMSDRNQRNWRTLPYKAARTHTHQPRFNTPAPSRGQGFPCAGGDLH